MWSTVLILALAAVIILLLVAMSRSADLTRQVGPDEGIDSAEIVRAYDKLSRWPQFIVIRKIIIHELTKCHPQGILVDIGCGLYRVIHHARKLCG